MAGTGFGAGLNGLANGINNAMELRLRKNYYDGLNDHRDRQDGLRQQQLAAKSEGRGGKGEDYEGFDSSLLPIFKADGSKQAAPQRSSMMSQAGLAPSSTTLPDTGLLSGNPAGAYQAGSLASVSKPQAQPTPDQPEEQINPRQQIVKDMMFGNLANEPDKLNAIAAAAAMHGLGDKITPWIEGLYKAKKSGVFDGAMSLLNNNVDGAIEQLKRGGINLEDRPVKVSPDDLDDHRWKINVAGTGERIMDVKNMVGSTMDADKFLKWQGDQQDAATKGRVADAQIKAHEASATASLAGAGLKSAQTKAVKSGGGLSDGSGKLPAPAATAQWLMQNGVYSNAKDAFAAVKTLNDKSPAAQRMALIEAGMKSGLSPGESAKDVDAFLAQSQSPAGQSIPSLPSGAKQIGTSKGKPVYEVNGRRFISE